MDPVRNPFAPGAGTQPPALAGRDDIILDADIALQRIMSGRSAKSQIFLGLRGTGKTVLLNKVEDMADEHNHITAYVEAPDNGKFLELLLPEMVTALRKFSNVESAKALAHAGLQALRSLVSVFKLSYGEFGLSVDPAPGTADSGNLEKDLVDVFLAVGRAAKSAQKTWTLLVDELQYLSEAELSALIVALHRCGQKQLPILMFGAGLPQIAALSGEAKSYAERLFHFRAIGPLPQKAALAALQKPIEDEGEQIDDEALAAIIKETGGYPYFLQEWGFQIWNLAEVSPIDSSVARAATVSALNRLDEGFFRVRFDRLTPKERDYVFAMAKLGKGPYLSGDVAKKLGLKSKSLGPRRANIIHKGMIYSPEHGSIDFTVPLYDEFLKRLDTGV